MLQLFMHQLRRQRENLGGRNLVTSKWSQFVFVIWMFTTYIVMQSYTTNLSSNMTVFRLQHSTNKLYCIGFQDGSFVKEILIKRLDFNVSRIKSYASVEEYYDALSKGCHNGGVDAILDELPFIKIFLDKYGETNYKLLGFGCWFGLCSRWMIDWNGLWS